MNRKDKKGFNEDFEADRPDHSASGLHRKKRLASRVAGLKVLDEKQRVAIRVSSAG